MYHKKEHGEPAKEEKKGRYPEKTGPPRRQGRLPERAPKEHIEVKIDTVVPPMPEKRDILAKPNWDTKFQPEYTKLREDTDKLRKERVQRVC